MASGVRSAAEVRRAAVGLGVSLEVALVASVETAACRVETVDLVAAAAVWEVEKAAEVKLVAAMAVAVRVVVSAEAAVQGVACGGSGGVGGKGEPGGGRGDGDGVVGGTGGGGMGVAATQR